MLARFEVQVALQYEFDIRDIGDSFTTGYIPYGTKVPTPAMYPQDFYGTEVFEANEANEALRNIVRSPSLSISSTLPKQSNHPTKSSPRPSPSPASQY